MSLELDMLKEGPEETGSVFSNKTVQVESGIQTGQTRR